MIYEAVVDLIGDVPPGMEPILFILCVPVLLFLLDSMFSILGAVVKWIGGK